MTRRVTQLAALLLAAAPSLAAEGDVDFARDIQPIFAKHCVSCHGPEKQKGGLRLDLKSAATHGGDAGPAFAAGKSNDSELIKRVRGDEPDDIMPPKGDPLTKAQVALLTKWIDQGAGWPDDAPGAARRKSDHWSFQPVKRPTQPTVKDTGWPRNGIDFFVLEKLEAKGIKPSHEADAYTLVRRVYLDLIGILPTPEEADAFVKEYEGESARTPLPLREGRGEGRAPDQQQAVDRSTDSKIQEAVDATLPQPLPKREGSSEASDAYSRLVDRLLASPHYGERWGRHWLDQARYADSNGYSIDSPRTMWPYRDWVIHALNADMPFDEFTVAQIAGDLLVVERQQRSGKSAISHQTSDISLHVATAFHRNTMINQEGGVKDDQFRIEASYDRVATTAQVWLGLTLACAQCHTHKFDPITQKEYYQFFAFFNSTEDSNNTGPTVSLASPDDEKKLAEIRAKLAPAEAALKAIKAGKELDKERAEAKKLVDAIKKELNEANGRIPSVMVMRELKTPRPSHIHIRGDFLRPGPAVTPDVPEVLPAIGGRESGDRGQESGARSQGSVEKTTGSGESPRTPVRGFNRLDLARWLVSPENPLTPRVTMNRLWLRYFPKGLVETEEDFGTQGAPPTHPQLLDWLASEFAIGSSEFGVRSSESKDKGRSAATGSTTPNSELRTRNSSAWSLKHMHRLIVTSATYRQSSNTRGDLAEIDPYNKLMARQSRLRVEAEIVRDLGLSASGLLSKKIGGPSVRPPQPAGVYNFTQNQQGWAVATGEDRYRRGMYTFFFRSAPYPMLTTFDVPNLTQTCTARLRSNTPLQSLTLANDEAMFEMAQALALRVMREGLTPLPLREGRGEGKADDKSDGTNQGKDVSTRKTVDATLPQPLPGREGSPDAARIERLFRLCLTRKPDAYESSRLLTYLKLQRERYGKDPAAARLVAPANKAKEMADSEAAAWTLTARAVMNLDEFITRE